MRRHNPCLVLMASLGLPFLLGSVVAFFGGSHLYYQYLGIRLPAFTAPVWAFTPVWWLMYLLMGLAAFLVWQRNAPGVRGALALYGAQLVFLLLWPLTFFGFYQYFIASALLAAQIVLVLCALRLFFRSNYLSGALLLPYPLWLFYLFYVNLGVAYLN